jgi:hypothetical protein
MFAAVALLSLTPAPEPTLQVMLEDVRGAGGHRYGVRDDRGSTLDCLKIVESPTGGYLGISHAMRDGAFTLQLSHSQDLLRWKHLIDLDRNASQPDLVLTPHGPLVAYEKDSPQGNWVRLRHYPDMNALRAGRHAREFDAPRSLAAVAEGTPHFRSVAIEAGLERSKIELGIHFWRDTHIDRQAVATLEDWKHWKATPRSDVNDLFDRLGIRGNVGDRDDFALGAARYELLEVQSAKDDWTSWRVYLRQLPDLEYRPLQIRTHGGSRSFANPTVTVLRLPDGRRGFVATLFLPSEGAAPGEAGCLVYHRALQEGALPDGSTAERERAERGRAERGRAPMRLR